MKKEFKVVKLLMLVLCLCGLVLAADLGVMVQFEKGATSAAIPIKLFDNIIYLPVRINDSEPLDFIYDTGASMISCIDEEAAAGLKMKFGSKSTSGGAGEQQVRTHKLENVQVSLPGLHFSRVEISTLPFASSHPFWGIKKQGLFGTNLISRVVTEIDYQGKKMILHAPHSYKHGESSEKIPFTPYGLSPFIKVKIEVQGKKEPIETLMLVDTGVRITTFNTPFVDKHGLIEKSEKTVENTTGYGIGGESVGVIGRVKTIRLGNIVLHDPVVDFSRDKKGALASDMFNGIIGADILYRFTVVFDYEKKIIALKKNSNFDQPFEYDMSGIYPIADGPGLNIFKIHRIVKDSPAEAAGLKPGDIITAIDSQDTTAMTLEQIKQVLKSEPGKKLNLRISRKGKILQISLTLKRLI
jgi:hypothetical protein